MAQKHESVLVVGGGIAGVTAAVEVAELGRQVFLVERSASLGGRVSAMKAYFPKLCPPACGLEINYRRLEQNPHVTVLNRCEVTSIEGEPGNLTVKLTRQPSYVKAECRDPVKPFEKLDASLPDPFNYGLAKRRPAGLAHPHAWPQEPFVMTEAIENSEIKSQLESLDCVDLGQKPEQFELRVGSIIWATGWKPYDAAAIDYLGYSTYPDVVTNVEFERLAAPDGPNAGDLKRPSDGRPVKKVAFVQCAGSRDTNHLPYCSAVCCLASLKQSTYVLDACEDAEAWMFYIDIRAGRYEPFLQRLQQNERMHLVKGKVGLVEATGSGTYRVLAEDIEARKVVTPEVDMVVLATGMVPATREQPPPAPWAKTDEFGFLQPGGGIVPAGCTRLPSDVAGCVQDATAAALEAVLVQSGR